MKRWLGIAAVILQTVVGLCVFLAYGTTASVVRRDRNGEVIVALAGPVSNLVMAVAASLVFRILSSGTAAPDRILTLIAFFVLYNVGLAIFNLIPIPPLDGSTLLFRLLPYETAYRLRPLLAQYGILILMAVIFLVAVGVREHSDGFYWTGTAFFVLLLVRQHRLVRPNDLSRVDAAFFTLNGCVSLAMFTATLLDFAFRTVNLI